MVKKKIVILGGGLGGLSAAYQLSKTQDLRDKFDVTLLQHGWRLGGKGASGRNPAFKKGERVEEHGLHMFMGFYENSWRMMRETYDHWHRRSDHPWSTIDDAFTPQRMITLEEDVAGKRVVWNLLAPWLPGTPGTDDGFGVDGDAAFFVDNAFRWLHHQAGLHPELAPLESFLHSVIANIHVPGFIARFLAGFVRIGQIIASGLDWALQGVLPHDDLLRRGLYLIELALAMIHGWLVDVLPYERHGVDAYSRLNNQELRAWLVSHHCPPHVSVWAPVKALYDLGFAYENGDGSSLANGRIAAGVGLKVLLRIALAYKNAPLFRMSAGMGDTVMTPLYQVLKDRGVTFQFFHRATKLHLSADKSTLDSVDVDVQVAPAVLGRSYRPLVGVGRLECWPHEPLYAQLAPGTPHVNYEADSCAVKVSSYTLTKGVDFDAVVCAIPKGALGGLGSELYAAKPRWKTMMDTIATVRTQASQVWMNVPTEDLGFRAGPTVQTCGVEPFDTWADMTDVLDYEAWGQLPKAQRPQSLHYFCSPMPEGALPPDPTTLVKARMKQQLEDNMLPVWPIAGSGTGFRWDFLVDPAGGAAVARLDAQYFRANVDGSERYVLSFDGQVDCRLHADDGATGSDTKGLFLAGDWIVTGLNAGSAESAVEGGMLAARAISGSPLRICDTEV